MKNSERLKNNLFVLREQIIGAIADEIKRLQELVKKSHPDDEVEVLNLQRPIIVAVHDEQNEVIWGIHTNGSTVSTEFNYDGCELEMKDVLETHLLSILADLESVTEQSQVEIALD